jgi:hypothetical protein
MATVVSSTFQIVTNLPAGTGTTNIAQGPGGRTFRLVSIKGTGADDAVITVSKVSSGGAVIQMGEVTIQNNAGGGDDNLNDVAGTMESIAARTVIASDTLRIVRSGGNSTRCILVCQAADGLILTES